MGFLMFRKKNKPNIQLEEVFSPKRRQVNVLFTETQAIVFRWKQFLRMEHLNPRTYVQYITGKGKNRIE